MPSDAKHVLNSDDVRTLRDLAWRVLEISKDPIMAERRRLWLKHASLKGERPMILAETGGVLDELIPIASLRCTEDWARGLERGLRNTIFMHERVNDDSVITPAVSYNWHVNTGDYGVQPTRYSTTNEGKLASYRWDPPLRNLREDFAKLRPRSFSVDREAMLPWKKTLEEVFGGILDVKLRGGFWWTLGMTWTAINLIGLEGLMLYMYDDPDGLHRLMAFLRDDHMTMIEWFEREGLLSLNNENDYVGSGSLGYTAELPKPGHKPGQPARLKDLWVLSESQETVGVSPEMFGEFIFPYQLPLMMKFGLAYYGCCEPVHARWGLLATIPNLRKVSVSPWCDQKVMAEACAGRCIFCRKPNPEQVSKPSFDEAAIREDLRTTLRIARNCSVELVMKDVHTVAEQPDRLGRWVQLARETIAETWQG